MIHVRKFVVNPISENSYVISDNSGEAVFIDPGFLSDDEKETVKKYISENSLKPVRMICTHCHFDHILGVEYIRDRYGLPFECHADDAFLAVRSSQQAAMFGFPMNDIEKPDSFIRDNEHIKFGNSELKAIHIPGHAPGHLVFYSEENNILFAGDVLFYGSIGRTDLPGGNYDELINNIKNKLLTLPDETIVYSGHGPETTIGFEKRNNPFLM